MGEKIKVLTSIEIDKNHFEIELNKATFSGGPRYIHLQNQRYRQNMTEKEFIELVLEMNKAAKKLRNLKGLEV